jgi:hypothetical protein
MITPYTSDAFRAKFSRGLRAYLDGDWGVALEELRGFGFL